ncbi:LacI family DNA-binding transcriptional regulator [Actinomyces faecalis]|uniref:LacI family DNA-binding transcriptional regulator n=1 Tax=Actinomyces faecalis TaxID=2722820 RepID=UPI001556D0FC|nr:LacI family DNA-binding transcriptional regulator [Actinomyces faecalis]
MTTLADVAQAAAVSTATASLVLSGKDNGRVSATTAKRVRGAARELGYVRNALAASMRSQRTRTLGVVANDVLSTPYAVSMVEGILTTARSHGWSVIFADTGGDATERRRAVEELRSRQVDAIIYAAMYHQEVVVDEGLEDVFVLNGFADRAGVPGAVPDEERAAFEATTHLIGLGHRRIAHLTHGSDAVAVALRIQGYRRALLSHGLPWDESLLLSGENDPAGADETAGRMLDLSSRPTAVFCYNDAMAAGVYRQAARRGLRIPQDLSVVGFDDLVLISTNLDPQLTTMRLPHYEMAEWMTRGVVAGGAQDLPPGVTRMRCELVERGSTAPPGPPSSPETSTERLGRTHTLPAHRSRGNSIPDSTSQMTQRSVP